MMSFFIGDFGRSFGRKFGLVALTVAVACSFVSRNALAMGLIRDAETEHIIREYSEPIFVAAGLDPKAVRIYIVNDNNINAFVAGGQRMFIHTGLITRTETPSQVIGVIAHETGHMAGGHLSRTQEALSSARVPFVLSMLLGIGAIAAGAGDAGAAILAGGTSVTQRSLLQYSRVQESAADQAAVTYLDRVGESGVGLLATFEQFRDQEVLSARQQDPYVRSHPISSQRLSALQDRVTKSPYYNTPDPPERVFRHEMLKAKLFGFLDRPDVTFRRYPPSDQSAPARYARSVAYHRRGELDRSMAELEPLLADYPDNPFLWELKGQILFESGKVAEAIPPYEKAVELAPDSPLLRVGLGQAMLALENTEMDREALTQLQIATQADRENPTAYRYLAQAYAENGDIGLAELSTAEQHYMRGDLKSAKIHAKRAQQHMPEGTPNWLRAEDIIQEDKPT